MIIGDMWIIYCIYIYIHRHLISSFIPIFFQCCEITTMCAEVHCMTSTSKIISKMMPTDSCVSSRRPVMTHPDAWNFVFSVLAPIPRYGYQPVWEVKRVKHLTRRVALHRTTHRAKLAKLETFVSFVSQLAQLLSCSSCCWAWWSLVEVAWISIEESLWTKSSFFPCYERGWPIIMAAGHRTVVSFIITVSVEKDHKLNHKMMIRVHMSQKRMHIISTWNPRQQQKQRHGFKGPLVWAPATFCQNDFRSGHESWTDSVQFLRLKPTGDKVGDLGGWAYEFWWKF